MFMEDRYYSRLIKVMVFIFDFYMINIAFTLSRKLGFAGTITLDQMNSLLLIFSLCWVIAGFNKIYNLSKYSLIKTISTHLLSILLVHAVMIAAILLVFKFYQVSISFLISVYIITALLIVGSRV